MQIKELFLYQFIKNPMSVGSISPSSRFLAKKMLQGVDFQKAKCIVEYGPGTGIFTEEILKQRTPETVVFVVENN